MSKIKQTTVTETYHCHYVTLPTTAEDLADMYEAACESYQRYHGHRPGKRDEIQVVIEEPYRIIFRWKGTIGEVGE